MKLTWSVLLYQSYRKYSNITPTTLWMNTVPEENWEETCYSEDTTTFAGLISGRRLGAPPGGVPPPPSLEQKVDKRLRALQGAPLPQALPFLLLLLLLFNLYDYPTTAVHFYWIIFWIFWFIPAGSPATVTWLCDLVMGLLGLLSAKRTAVLGDSFLGALACPRIAVSLSRVVGPRLRVVSAAALWEGKSVWMAVSVRSDSDL